MNVFTAHWGIPPCMQSSYSAYWTSSDWVDCSDWVNNTSYGYSSWTVSNTNTMGSFGTNVASYASGDRLLIVFWPASLNGTPGACFLSTHFPPLSLSIVFHSTFFLYYSSPPLNTSSHIKTRRFTHPLVSPLKFLLLFKIGAFLVPPDSIVS